MKHFKKLQSLKKMPGYNNDLMYYLKSLSAKQPDNSPAREMIDTSILILQSAISEYYNLVKKYYTPGYGNRYPGISAKELKHLQDSVNSIYTNLHRTKKKLIDVGLLSKKNEKYFDVLSNVVREDQIILNRIELRGNMSLPSAVYKHSGNAYDIDYVKKIDKGVSFFEYSKIFVDKDVSEKSVIKSYMNKSKEDIMKEYTAAIESDPKYYEYSGINTIIPVKILNTGNPDDIAAYLNSEEAGKLTYPEQFMLKKHREIAIKKKAIDDEALVKYANNSEYGEKPELIVHGEDDVELNISQPAFQSSKNGCWSCAGQMMLQSRGVKNISQEDIRAYRPDLKDDNDIKPDSIEKYNYDIGNNLLERADSVLAFAPNSMLHETQVMPYGELAEKTGITMEQYINKTVAFLKSNIKNAIITDKSPVALLLPGHYITITGISGDTIKYKESAKGLSANPDATHVMSLKKMVTDQFNKSKEYLRLPVSITWISDIKLSKDNKKLYNIPSVHTSVDNEGNLVLPPDNLQQFADANMTDMNRNGVVIQRNSGKENDNSSLELTDGGVVKVERVYMPKKLNIEHLKNMADMRAAAEEEKLIENDKLMLGIDRKMPVEPIEHIEINADNEQPKVNDIKEDHYSLGDIVKTVSDLIEDYKNVNPKWLISRSQYSVNIEIALDEFKDKINEMNNNIKNGVKVSEQLRKETYDALKTLTDSVEEYLSYKQVQFLKDPSRKNSFKKQINEQPKIKTTIDMLDKLYAINNSLNNKGKGPEDIAADNAHRINVIDGLRKSMLSNKSLGIDNKKLQEATYKNCTDIDIRSKKQFEMMESFFGMSPDESLILPNVVSTIEKNGKKVSEFSLLKKIENNFKAIGSDDPIDKLSNKDFVAVAAAASTTKEVYNSIKNNDSYENKSMYYICGSCQRIRQELFTSLDGLENSRQMAAKALTAYKNGDKKPLAHLIKEGITNIVQTYNLSKNPIFDVYQCMGELGLRLKNMMDRDTELRNLAIKDGLNYEYTKRLELVGFRGKNFVRWSSYASKKANTNKDHKNIDSYPWSIEQRKEKYAEMLFCAYFYEYEKNLEFELLENPDYQKELYALSDKSKIEMFKATITELKSFKDFYSNNPEMKARLNGIEAEYKEAERVFKNEKKTSNKAYDNFYDAKKTIDNKLLQLVKERIDNLNAVKNTVPEKDKAKIEKELSLLDETNNKLDSLDRTVLNNYLSPAIKKASLKYVKSDENHDLLCNPIYREKFNKAMRDYIVNQELYKLDEITFINTMDKISLPPDRFLEVIFKNIPMIKFKQIKNEFDVEFKKEINAEIKEWRRERSDKTMRQVQRQAKKPDIFLR